VATTTKIPSSKQKADTSNNKRIISFGHRGLDRALFSLASTIASRASLADKLGKSYWSSSGTGAKRNLYEALGYEQTPTYSSYAARYKRQDIAKPIVEAASLATWGKLPSVVEREKEETEFEKAWRQLVRKRKVYAYLRRMDIVAGIGQFGILLLGFDDVSSFRELENPVESAKELLYLRPYSQGSVEVDKWEDDVGNERYGLPRVYKVVASGAGGVSRDLRIHHTRVIHVAEGLVDNDTYGTPRLEPVLNRLQDLELVSGGSAEMFWRGSFPGYAFKAQPDAVMETQDLDDLEDEIQDYLHELRRYIRLQGIDVQELAPQVASPADHVDVLVTLIAAGARIPKRILLGSERGELASSQDERAWQERIDERRVNFAEAVLLRPLIDRLVEVGVLPPPKGDEEEEYSVEWPSMLVLTPKEQMEIARMAAEAIAKFVSAPGAELVMPVELFLEKYLHWSKEEIEQRAEMVRGLMEEVTGDNEE